MAVASRKRRSVKCNTVCCLMRNLLLVAIVLTTAALATPWGGSAQTTPGGSKSPPIVSTADTPAGTERQHTSGAGACLLGSVATESETRRGAYYEGGGHNTFFTNSTQRDDALMTMIAFLRRHLGA